MILPAAIDAAATREASKKQKQTNNKNFPVLLLGDVLLLLGVANHDTLDQPTPCFALNPAQLLKVKKEKKCLVPKHP